MIVFAKGAHYALKALGETEYDVIQIDWTVDPVEARKLIGPDKTLQGNLDPCVLYGDANCIKDEVEKMVTAFGTHRYIANLGHGMHPTHDPEHLGIFVNQLHAVSERQIQENKTTTE
jgi:uroporphyrinogen decarboxylase